MHPINYDTLSVSYTFWKRPHFSPNFIILVTIELRGSNWNRYISRTTINPRLWNRGNLSSPMRSSKNHIRTRCSERHQDWKGSRTAIDIPMLLFCVRFSRRRVEIYCSEPVETIDCLSLRWHIAIEELQASSHNEPYPVITWYPYWTSNKMWWGEPCVYITIVQIEMREWEICSRELWGLVLLVCLTLIPG